MHLAYVFERFPSFTQTFCAREIVELQRQGLKPLIFSIHDVADEAVKHFPAELAAQVITLPQEKDLPAIVKQFKRDNRLPQCAVLTLREWGEQRTDKMRVYEALWIGLRLQEAGIRHVHSHFAGLAARTCWWLRQFFGIEFSFTAHANDVFCAPDVPVTLSHLMRDAAGVVTVSDFTARWLTERFPGSRKKIRRVYNGLDLVPITEATTGTTKDVPPLIFSVGRLIEKKGFDDLITSCGLIRDAGVEFTCAIAGEGPLEEDLSAQIRHLGLESHVKLLGPLPQSEITRILGRAEIFALPCVTEKDGGMDNLPTVLMEAMAARLPCVSTRLAGVPEMVIHGETGLLCSERQPQEFSGLLLDLLGDATSRRSFGEAGLLRARALFAKEATAAQLMDFFSEFAAINLTEDLTEKHPRLRKLHRKRTLSRLWQRFFGKKPPTKTPVFP